MIAAGVTWLPATPRTAFRGHAFLLALADPKLQPHPSKSEAAPESVALSEEAMPSGAPTAVRPPLPSSRSSEPGTPRRGAPGRTSGGWPARRKAGQAKKAGGRRGRQEAGLSRPQPRRPLLPAVSIP